MPRLHDAAVRAHLHARLDSITPDATRRWGKMTVDQMLWHVNQSLSIALGETTEPPMKVPVPLPVARFMLLSLPWPRSAPTLPGIMAGTTRHDFTAEKARCKTLIDKFAAHDLNGDWAAHPALGKMSGAQNSKLQAKHLNHHFTQFSA